MIKLAFQNQNYSLRETLQQKPPESVRRNCIESLARIKHQETKKDMLLALKDNDPEVRIQAAYALRTVLKCDGAVQFVTEELLQHDETEPKYIDALRQIDNEITTKTLREKLTDPDPKISQRAYDALARLGGEDAFRTLQTHRKDVLKNYTKLLGDADDKIMKQFGILMKQARIAFRTSMSMHVTIFVIGVGVLIASVYLALKGKMVLAAGGSGLSLATLVSMFYKDPIKNIGHSVNNLVKVNVVFLGYMRQINQIDATFKQMFLSASGFGLEQLQKTVKHIQTSVEQTLAKVKSYLPE